MKQILITFFCLFYICTNAQTVTKVLDGDTIIVENLTVRILKIDSPEKNQTYGKESKAYLSRLILFKKVKVVYSKLDKYGRTLADVYINGRSVAEIMIESGNAWHYSYFDSSFILAQKQITARRNKLGLWKYKAINPYNFRKNGIYKR